MHPICRCQIAVVFLCRLLQSIEAGVVRNGAFILQELPLLVPLWGQVEPEIEGLFNRQITAEEGMSSEVTNALCQFDNEDILKGVGI